MKHYMQTYVGELIDFENPDPDRINIMDIAHGLANIARYCGQTTAFYSVAQHSVHMAEFAKPEHALRALLHDAQEVYLQDLPGPLKALCPGYVAVEDRFEEAIRIRFGFTHKMPRAIKVLDAQMLMTEKRQLFEHEISWGGLEEIESLALDIDPWPPDVAEKIFLKFYAKLSGLAD